MEITNKEQLMAFLMELKATVDNLVAAQPPVEEVAEEQAEQAVGEEVLDEALGGGDEPPAEEVAGEDDLEVDELEKLLQ